MIIEFFGEPGSGKTTLMRKLLAALPHAREARAISRGDIASGTLFFALHHPISFFTLMFLLCVYARGFFRYKLGLLLRSMAARARAETLSGVVFVDEGMVQRMLSLFDSPISERMAGFLMRSTPMPSAIIALFEGDFSRFTREPDRFGSPRVRQGREGLEDWIQAVRTNVRTMRRALPDSVRVIEYKRDAEPADLQDLQRQIERLVVK